MPRYELRGERFWEITRAGTTLTIVSGNVGSAGRKTTKSAESDEAAEALCEQLIGQMEERGYALAGTPQAAKPPRKAEARNSDLETAIARDPEDPGAYSVYADWLQGQNELRGELIAAQLADTPKARAAAEDLLERHAWYFIGALAHDPALTVSWQRGFIHSAEIVEPSGGSPGARNRTLEALLAHPSARFLVSLKIEIEAGDAAATVATLTRLAPRSLRQLELFARCELPSLGELFQACPDLRELEVAAHSFGCGKVAFPGLLRARFLCTALGGRATRQLASAHWPALERLDIYFGDGSATFDDIRPLLERTDLPKLAHLKLRGAAFVGALCRALPASRFANQLTLLDLSKGELAEGDDFIAFAAHRFERLKELRLPVTLAHARMLVPSVEQLAKQVIGAERVGNDRTIAQLTYEDADDDYFEGVQE